MDSKRQIAEIEKDLMANRTQQIILSAEYAASFMGEQIKNTQEIMKMKAGVDQLEKAIVKESVWTDLLGKALERFKVLEEDRAARGQHDEELKGIYQQLKEVYADLVARESKISEQHADMLRVGRQVIYAIPKLEEWLEKPSIKEVHIRYFLGRPFWILLGMCLVCSMAVGFGIFEYSEARQFRENDMKWRYLQVNAMPGTRAVLNVIDSNYSADAKAFIKDLSEKERRVREAGVRVLDNEKAVRDEEAPGKKERQR